MIDGSVAFAYNIQVDTIQVSTDDWWLQHTGRHYDDNIF